MPRARTHVNITASIEGWQYALIVGLSEIRKCKFSSALQYLLKLGYVKLSELVEQQCFEGQEQELLKKLTEEVRGKRNK